MKSFLILPVILLCTLISPTFAADDEFFPIMAWNHVPSDPAVMKKMRECGITMAMASPVQLDMMKESGMKAIVTDPRTSNYKWDGEVDAAEARKNVESLIAEIGNHPAIFGYYIRDEPNAAWFANLEKVASVVREKAPGKWPYINLFPLYAEDWQLGAKTYSEYLEKFVTTCKPPIMSYDNYS